MSDKFIQLKQKYIKSFVRKHNDIESAWGEKDFPQLEYLLHKLAGSSGGYGFSRLNHLCTQAESTIKEEHPVDNQNLSDLVQHILNQLKAKS